MKEFKQRLSIGRILIALVLVLWTTVSVAQTAGTQVIKDKDVDGATDEKDSINVVDSLEDVKQCHPSSFYGVIRQGEKDRINF